MPVKLELTPVDPVGRRTHRLFKFNRFIRETDLDVYPPCPEAKAFREFRQARFGLRAAARRLGITATLLSALERGEYTCNWADARRMLGDDPGDL